MSTILLTTYYLLIPCSYLQVYTNIRVACQTTEVTYRSPTPSFLQAKPCADHHLSITLGRAVNEEALYTRRCYLFYIFYFAVIHAVTEVLLTYTPFSVHGL